MRVAAPFTVASLALAASLAAGCGPKAKGSTIENHGGAGTAAPPAATLADDVALLAQAAKNGERHDAWSSRVTFVGWTADRQIAYRVLICDPDELGGRGPFCELRVCSRAAAADDVPMCEHPASFELYGDIDFDAAATTTAAEAALAALGPLTAGTARPLDVVALTVDAMALHARVLDQPIELTQGFPDQDRGVTAATATYVGDSADGTCRAVVGIATYRSDYEGVHGNVPHAFAAVACK